MIRIFNRLLLTTASKSSNRLVNLRYLTDDATDKFGTGSKFIGLDSASKTRNLNKSITKKDNENPIDDPDTFGTITNECNSMYINHDLPLLGILISTRFLFD